MLRSLRYLGHAGSYVAARHVLRRRRPFIGGLVVNDRCNLNCKHCRVGKKDGKDATADELFAAMREFRRLGIRSVFFVGGEPMIWRDGELTLESLIEESLKMGFLVTTIYTNGTRPIETKADTVFVSIDGLRESNDRLRGAVFDQILGNIADSKNRNILVNSTINRENEAELESLVEFVDSLPNVRGQYFYFHTPYYGFDDMYLNIEEKRPIIDRLIRLKKKGYRILNSYACLEAVRRDDWQRPSDLCCVWIKGKLIPCCRSRGDDELCKHCGYLGYAELQKIISLHPSALKEAVNAYMPRKRRRVV